MRRQRSLLDLAAGSALGLERLEGRWCLAADAISTLALARGDFDNDGILTAHDIDLLSEQVRRGGYDVAFDANRDGELNGADRLYWVESILHTYVGDADLNGQFNTSDLVVIFAAGQYEDDLPGNGGWASGDWTGDGEFGSGDLVEAFARGGYEVGPRPLRTPELTVSPSFGYGSLGDHLTSFDLIDLKGLADPFVVVALQRENEDDKTFAASDELGRFEFTDVAIANGTNKFDIVVSYVNGQQRTTSTAITRTCTCSDALTQPQIDAFLKSQFTPSEYPASFATAYMPAGMTRADLFRGVDGERGDKQGFGRAWPSLTSPLLQVLENEPRFARGLNDSLATAEPIASFGTGQGKIGSVRITGSVSPRPGLIIAFEDDGDINRATETNLLPNQAVTVRGAIGDGPYGSQGLATGDSDFFAVRGVRAGQVITIDVYTPFSSSLDSFVYVYSSQGERVAVADDDGSSTDTYLRFVAPRDDDYYISVAAYGSFGPIDPFDSISGIGAASEGTYELLIGLQLDNDADMFAFQLEAGDILGASIFGGPTHLTLRDEQGNELVGSPQDASYVYPVVSPLPRGGRATLSWTVDTPGTYVLAADGGVGDYELDVAAFRPFLEQQQRDTRQVLLLDFDGATISPQDLFGFGSDVTTLSPLADFLHNWGLTPADEPAVIDAIVATVEENFRDLGLSGNNGDRLLEHVDGDYQLDIVTSTGFLPDTGTSSDVFNSDHVSRVIVGGTVQQLGITVLGLAESIDPGNFNTRETAVVLLDLLSSQGDHPSSLNGIPLAPSANIIDLIGRAVGNIVTHEAGHFFGTWHTNQDNEVANVMDQGGNLSSMIGLGADRIFGTLDDIDVDFVNDRFVPNERFSGVQNTLNALAFSLATGTVDGGMLVTETVPANDNVLDVPPTEFVVRFLDPFDDTQTILAGDLLVNGIQADDVLLSGPQELTFRYDTSPVTSQGQQSLRLAAGAVKRASDGSPVAEYTAEFDFDAVPMVVTSITPSGGLVRLPFGNIDVTFSEPFDRDSIGPDDLQMNLGEVTDAIPLDDVTVRYLVGNLVSEGELLVTLRPAAVTDRYGFPAEVFSATYLTEIELVPFTVPLEPVLPLGSLIYDSVMQGKLADPTDVDAFDLRVDAGQAVTFVLEANSQLQGKLTVMQDGNLLGMAQAENAGQAVILRVDVGRTGGAAVDEEPELVVAVESLAESMGQYRLGVWLNAVAEEEYFGYPANDTLDAAQPLESTYQLLPSPNSQRAAVVGGLQGALIDSEDFESGQLDTSSWTVRSSTQYGRIAIGQTTGSGGGAYALVMDVARANEANLNEAIWTVTLGDAREAILSFDHASYADEAQGFPGRFVGSYPADGIAISDDGIHWYPVFDAPSGADGQWLSFDVDLASAARAAGISLDRPLQIKFQQCDDAPLAQDGRGWDNIRIRRGDAADWYRFQLQQGETASVVATVPANGQVQVELYNAAGEVVARGWQHERPVTNGGFESGSLAGWTVEANGGVDPSWRVAAAGTGGFLSTEPLSPQVGQFFAWSNFETNRPSDTTLYQDVTIPADSEIATLSWQQRIDWLFWGRDHLPKAFGLQVRDPTTNAVLATPASFTTPTGSGVRFGSTGWQPHQVDLSEFIGSTIRLAFFQSLPEAAAGPAQIGLDDIRLDMGQIVYENVTDVIANYSADASNEFLVRVTGDRLTEYSLMVLINGAGDLEANDRIESAQSLSSNNNWVLGYLDGADDSDVYVVSSPAGPFRLETLTPAAAAGEFENRLDPLLRLYDSQGRLLAEDDNSSDGVNALILFQPQDAESEFYYIEVVAAESQGAGAAGEYILSLHDSGRLANLRAPANARATDAVFAAAVLVAERPAFSSRTAASLPTRPMATERPRAAAVRDRLVANEPAGSWLPRFPDNGLRSLVYDLATLPRRTSVWSEFASVSIFDETEVSRPTLGSDP